jgi:hypothetical protein
VKGLNFSRCALGICAAAAMLAGCGGSSPPIGTSGSGDDTRTYHRTFKYSGKEQTFQVPAGVTQVTVVALGAAGGPQPGSQGNGALGGRVSAELPVKPGEQLAVFVGGAGASGGYNGGGSGQGRTDYASGAGGGASDIREGGSALKDRILVAGGGGGEGESGRPSTDGSGGQGGGKTGGRGVDGENFGGHDACRRPEGDGGGGGTQQSGGTGGHAHCRLASSGKPGILGNGGAGGTGIGGGGGGGGYYGGGGGGGGNEIMSYGLYGGGGGGGGGSSYAERNAREYQSWRGWKDASGDGSVVFSWRE